MTTHFDPAKPFAVVFYFLGEPERSQVRFSKKVETLVEEKERDEVLIAANEEANEKSDPNSQLESFLMELSIRLKRLEEQVAEEGGLLRGGKMLTMPDDQVLVNAEPGLWEKLLLNQGLFYTLLGLAVLIPAALLGLFGRWIANKRKVYLFPDAAGSPLLEAPHAGGVGGVLSFSSAEIPPSNQKQEEPDYLQKI